MSVAQPSSQDTTWWTFHRPRGRVQPTNIQPPSRTRARTDTAWSSRERQAHVGRHEREAEKTVVGLGRP